MRLAILFLVLAVVIIPNADSWRRRRWRFRAPRIRIRLPRIRLPRIRLPRIRLPRIRIPIVRRIIRQIARPINKVIDKVKEKAKQIVKNAFKKVKEGAMKIADKVMQLIKPTPVCKSALRESNIKMITYQYKLNLAKEALVTAEPEHKEIIRTKIIKNLVKKLAEAKKEIEKACKNDFEATKSDEQTLEGELEDFSTKFGQIIMKEMKPPVKPSQQNLCGTVEKRNDFTGLSDDTAFKPETRDADNAIAEDNDLITGEQEEDHMLETQIRDADNTLADDNFLVSEEEDDEDMLEIFARQDQALGGLNNVVRDDSDPAKVLQDLVDPDKSGYYAALLAEALCTDSAKQTKRNDKVAKAA